MLVVEVTTAMKAPLVSKLCFPIIKVTVDFFHEVLQREVSLLPAFLSFSVLLDKSLGTQQGLAALEVCPWPFASRRSCLCLSPLAFHLGGVGFWRKTWLTWFENWQTNLSPLSLLSCNYGITEDGQGGSPEAEPSSKTLGSLYISQCQDTSGSCDRRVGLLILW